MDGEFGGGSHAFVEEIEGRVRNRRETDCVEDGGSWVLRDACDRYGSQFGLKKSPIAGFESHSFG